MAYILGFFAADGYITVNKRGGQFWCIQITDKQLLAQIKKSIGAEHKISARISKKKNEKILYRLQIGSIEMCNDLRNLGFSEKKTKSLAVPHIPRDFFPSFVRGYFDGDGNVWVGSLHKSRKNPGLAILTMFTSSSLAFLTQLRQKLSMYGIKGGSLYMSKKNYSRLQYSTNDSLKLSKIMYNGSHTSISLLRKRKIFLKYENMRLRL